MPPPSLLSPQIQPDEEPHDFSLRPDSFQSYIGQEPIKESLGIAIGSAKQRKAPVDHVLLYGPPGLGKTSLAYLIAREMGTSLRITSGPALGRSGDLASLLTTLQAGDVLFIDEIHRLHRAVEEILYPAMEDNRLDILIGKGPTARSVNLKLPPFTLVGATTRAGSLSQPLRERFGLIHRLDYYEEIELAQILKRSAKLLEITVTPEAREHIASRSRKTPRVANRLLRRIRDYSLVKGLSSVDASVAAAALDQLRIDSLGLDTADRLVLQTIFKQFAGGPVGLETLSAATGEEAETIEDVIEPYLLRLGFLQRTPRGRIITDLAKNHLGFREK